MAATVAASLALGQAHAAAADITVDVLTDTGGTAAECQLRDAIASANTGGAVDGCEAGTNNGSDNIFFTVTGMITLSGGPLIVDANEPVQFFGPEDEINLTISGGSTQGIIDAAAPIRLDSIGLTQAQRSGNGGGISSTSSVELFNVSMDNLSTTGGSGGCVYAASVSVTQSTLSHNDAAANGGCLNTTGGASILNSNFMDNEAELDAGGAIASLGGTLTVTESTFGGTTASDANVSDWGGAIYTESIVDIKGSTFLGNKAEDSPALGGAIYNPAGIGGTIANSTFFGNVADATGGSIAAQGTALTLRNNTILSNPTLGADVAHTSGSGTVTLANNIIEDFNNALGSNCAGAMNDAGYNVVSGDLPGSTCPTGGTNVAQTPLMVTPIENWGGPTRTFMLQGGSPAVDLIPPANCPLATDQRRAGRPDRAGAFCDAGSVEVDYLPDGLIAKQGGVPVGDDIYNDTGDDQLAKLKVKPGKAAKFTLTPGNDAELRSDRFLVEGPGSKGRFKVSYKQGGTNVTEDVTGDGHETTPAFAGDVALPIGVKVKALKTARKGKQLELPITLTSINFSSRSDTVRVEVTVR